MENKFEKEGYTLIEFLVVIFIIFLLNSIIFLNYRSEEKNLVLLRAAHKLANDIRKVQNMALNVKECCGGIIPPGYGVYLISGSDNYLVYADTYPSGGNERYDSGDVQIERIYFEKGVYIKMINFSSASRWSINFKPPYSKTAIKRVDGEIEQDEVVITLALKNNPQKTKTVRVNKAGLIAVE